MTWKQYTAQMQGLWGKISPEGLQDNKCAISPPRTARLFSTVCFLVEQNCVPFISICISPMSHQILCQLLLEERGVEHKEMIQLTDSRLRANYLCVLCHFSTDLLQTLNHTLPHTYILCVPPHVSLVLILTLDLQ